MRLIRANTAVCIFAVSLLAITAVLTVAFFSRLYADNQYWDLFLSSDALYLPSLYQDLVVDGNSLDTWHLNPAPNFFPDMGFYFILRFICGNFIWSTFLFAFFQLLVIQVLLLYIFRQLFPGKLFSYAPLILTSLVFIGCEALFFMRDISIAFHPFSNSYHVGAFVVSIICFVISRDLILRPRLFEYVVLVLLCFLTTASDRLFLILFPAPFISTAVLLWLRQKPWQVILYTLFVGAACYGGLKFFNHIDRNSYEVLGQRMVGTGEEITRGWSEFSKNIYDVVSQGGFKSLAFCLTFISLPLMGVLIFKSRRGSPGVLVYSVYVLFFSLMVLFAPILSGKYYGYDCLRYNIFPFFLGGLNLSVFLAFVMQGAPSRYGVFLTPAILIVASVVFFSRINKEGLDGYFNHYPPYVARLDSMAEREGLKSGVGNYWIAKKVTMFSKKGIKVRSVFDDLSVYDHVQNDPWFFDNIFTFVLLERFNDTTLYRKVIKNPRAVVYDEQLKLIKADTFGYTRDIGYRVVSFK